MVVAFVALHGSDPSPSSATLWKRICLPQQADTDMLGNPDWSATTAVLGLATDDGVHGEVAMTELKIAIIVGSTRPGRHSPAVAEWVLGQAAERQVSAMSSSTSQTIFCRCTTKPYPRVTGSVRTSTPRHGRATIAPYDGYIFVSPSKPLDVRSTQECPDHLYAEWHNMAPHPRPLGSLSGWLSCCGAPAIVHARRNGTTWSAHAGLLRC